MKTIILSLLPILMFGQTSFDQANELYQQEKFEEAVLAYEQILETGEHSVELYFNLGNTYYKLNQVAPAVYNYEKALLLEPNNSEVKNNLKFAQNMMIDEVKEIPKVGFANWLSEFTSVYHYDMWAKIAIAFSVLFLLGFIGYYLSRKVVIKRVFFSLMILLLLFCVLSIIISVFEKNQAESYNPAIVFSETVSVKGEPKEVADNIMIIHEGTKVLILEEVDNWYKVEFLNGTNGWIQKESVRTLK